MEKTRGRSTLHKAPVRPLANAAEPHGRGVRPPPRAILGNTIDRLRTQRGWTQDDLAGLAEIDRRYVQRIEAGTANPGIDVLCRVREALRASWDELLRGLGKTPGD